jgi:membrane protein YqaA with SNARE-associated domain
MSKLLRLLLIGTALAAFAGVAILAEKLGGTIFFWIGIALLSAFARRRREALKEAKKARDQCVDAKTLSG